MGVASQALQDEAGFTLGGSGSRSLGDAVGEDEKRLGQDGHGQEQGDRVGGLGAGPDVKVVFGIQEGEEPARVRHRQLRFTRGDLVVAARGIAPDAYLVQRARVEGRGRGLGFDVHGGPFPQARPFRFPTGDLDPVPVAPAHEGPTEPKRTDGYPCCLSGCLCVSEDATEPAGTLR